MTSLVWKDGAIAVADAAPRGPGPGVFETLRGPPLFRPDAHWRRLRRALDGRVPDVDACVAQARRAAEELAAAAGDPRAAHHPHGFLLRVEVPFASDITAATRDLPERLPVRVTTRPMGARLAHKELARPGLEAAHAAAVQAGFDDALLVAGDQVVEATASNVVAVRDGIVHAPGPSAGALDGITRAFVLELATGSEVRDTLSVAALHDADEACLVSTRGIRPIMAVDDGALPEGPFTKAWAAAYEGCFA